ncbi:MAG: YraN family protein [Ignavibacteriales bacterium]|nr:YraN family protein [Ignavibacteriales bacterium]
MNTNKRKTGNYGEDLACKFLQQLGYQIVERNYFYGHGEIDIIVKDKDELVFIEVKYRTNDEYGPPELSISKGKQKLIRRTAEAYLFDKKISEQNCRIDLIAILHLKDEKPKINHIKNAF